MVHADLQFDKVEKVDTSIPLIEFVIPEKLPEVEYKVYLFSMLPKTIPQLQQVLCASKCYVPDFSFFNDLKLEVEFSPTKGV